MLDAMMELLVINYIIANHEYDMVLQNHLHYFLGRNAQCITYVKNAGYTRCADGEALTDNSIHNAKLMALLTAIGQCEQIVWEY